MRKELPNFIGFKLSRKYLNNSGLNPILNNIKKIFFLVGLLLSFCVNQSKAQSPLCASSPTSFGYEYVSSVSINGATTSGNTGYSGPGYIDYTGANLTNLVAGNTYPISITVQTNYTYQEFVKVWLDFNGNLNLQDAGELVFDQVFSFWGTHTYTGNITIPTTAYNGNVYMRINMVYSAVPALCGSYSYGNTFDYKLGISGGVTPSVLAVTTAGIGGALGSVTSLPAGINTASNFSTATFPNNSVVNLTATPTGSGSTFSNWSGAVSSTSNPLAVTMDVSKTVTANFIAALPLALSTTAITSITTSSASSGGNITGDGGLAISARGVCWSTSSSPTIANTKTNDGTGIGLFSSSVSGLLPNTTYYLRSYATNTTGTVYGTQISFLTQPANLTSITASANAVCPGGSSILTANGAQGTVNWFTGSCLGVPVGTGNSITVSPTVATTYYAINNNGSNSASCVSITITVNTPPTIASISNSSQNTTAGLCGAIVNFAATISGTPTPTVTYSIQPGSLFNVGTTLVTVTATNSCGVVSSNFNVQIIDNQAPVINTKNISIFLDASAQANISFADIDNGTTDACGILSTTLSKTSFNLSNVGSNTVSINVKDINGNISIGSVVITVISKGINALGQIISDPTKQVDKYGAIGSGLGRTAFGQSFGTLPTLIIGSQQWMDKNLAVETYRNGDIIPQVTSVTAWAGLTTGAWCYLNNDPANGAIYGKLYNWYAVNDSRGLAPAGWHIPTDTEWTTLGTTLGGDAVAGGKLKTTGTSLWISPNTNATNESGFEGLPGSLRNTTGGFISFGNNGFWWSATTATTSYVWFRYLASTSGSLLRSYNSKQNGYSVRCIRD